MEIKTLIATVTLVLMMLFGNNTAVSLTDEPPLYLTSLIENGKISEARNLSLVKDDIIPRSHSGLITVDKHHGNHLFFWFFPAAIQDRESPLLVWLNGGPGFSSMIGLFLENGPVRLDVPKNMTGSKKWCKEWQKSWATPFNMLYIDQPVGVGYSYTEDELHGYRVTQDGYAKDLYEFIKQFYVMFPEYMSRELYLGGQSYAGKYVPAFAYHLHTEILANRLSIPLKGIYLGGPLFDSVIQGRESAKFYEALGAMRKKQREDFQTEFEEFVKLGNYSNTESYDIFCKNVPHVGISYGLIDNYFTLVEAQQTALNSLMNTKEMRDAVHVGNLTYQVFNGNFFNKFNQDIMVSSKPKLAILMDAYKVLIYNGDLDGVINSMMIDAGLMTTNWTLQAEYNNSVAKLWGTERQPKGFYSKTGQFCRVVIRAAGHQVPQDQPDVSLDMMKQFIKYGCIQ